MNVVEKMKLRNFFLKKCVFELIFKSKSSIPLLVNNLEQTHTSENFCNILKYFVPLWCRQEFQFVDV